MFQIVVLRGRRKGFRTLPKVSKTRGGFCSMSKSDGRPGTFEEECGKMMKDAFRVAGAVQENTRDMFIRDVRRSGQRFPKRGCILEYEIFRFSKVILRDRCSTLYDPASLFRGRRSTFDKWSGKNRKAHWYTQLSIFEGCLAEWLRF